MFVVSVSLGRAALGQGLGTAPPDEGQRAIAGSWGKGQGPGHLQILPSTICRHGRGHAIGRGALRHPLLWLLVWLVLCGFHTLSFPGGDISGEQHH